MQPLLVSDGRLIRVNAGSNYYRMAGLLLHRGWQPWSIDHVVCAIMAKTSLSVLGVLQYMVERDDWKANVLDDY